MFNRYLNVRLRSKGGSLCSIRDHEGTEYLWQGDPAYWSDQAPNLFPYIARLTKRKYILDGKEYTMDIHGFVKDSELRVVKQGENHITLVLEDTPDTRIQYPYQFRYEICYQLHDRRLEITYRVVNQDNRTMYFGLGGHPGFRVPIDDKLNFEDYYLQFASGAGIQKVGMTEDRFVNGEMEAFPLSKGNRLPLDHSLFDNDAIILYNMPRQTELVSDKSPKGIRVSYPQMPYLGLWHKPKSDAPYLCIEPWTSLPSRKDVIEDLARQENLISLDFGQCYENVWEIEILNGNRD